VLEVASENDVEVEMPGNFYSLVRAGEGEASSPEKAPSVKVLFSDIATLPKTSALYYGTESEFPAKVLGIVHKKYVVLDQTAFYPEGGGQTFDTGTLDGVAVKQVTKQGGVVLHEVADVSRFKTGQHVKGAVDIERRKTIARHHTAAHMLNAACRSVLGPHIWQGGSGKDEEKAHLDLTHYRKITNDELAAIEQKVNAYVMENLPIQTHVLPRNEAESKYGFTIYQGGAVPGKELRIVSVGGIDSEACGGTHSMNKTTGEIGPFKIVRRESVQDGIERITYKCGHVAVAYVQERERLLHDAASVVSVSEGELVRTIERFFTEWKVQRKKIEALGELLVKEEAREIIDAYPGRPVMKVLDLDDAALRKLALKVAESDKAAAVLLGKSGAIICAAGKDSGQSAKSLLDKALKALGGTGGGSDRIAQGKAQKIALVEL